MATTNGIADGDTLGQTDRNRIIAELEGSRDAFVDVTVGLSSAQWHFKTGPGRWSIAECATHVAMGEDFLFEIVINKVMKYSSATGNRERVAGKDDVIMKVLLDRGRKGAAPDAMDPARHPLTPEATLEHFRASRARTMEYVKSTEGLQNLFLNHPDPALGALNAYECMLVISAHTRRHTLQILEVKASRDFPER